MIEDGFSAALSSSIIKFGAVYKIRHQCQEAKNGDQMQLWWTPIGPQIPLRFHLDANCHT